LSESVSLTKQHNFTERHLDESLSSTTFIDARDTGNFVRTSIDFVMSWQIHRS
jgi:hypothetical protein